MVSIRSPSQPSPRPTTVVARVVTGGVVVGAKGQKLPHQYAFFYSSKSEKPDRNHSSVG